MESSIYNRQELIKLAKELHGQADKRLWVTRKGYTKDYDRRVRFATIFLAEHYVLLDSPCFSLECGTFRLRRVKKLLPYGKDFINWPA